MEYAYTDPTGFIETFGSLINGETSTNVKPLTVQKSLNRLINYKFGEFVDKDPKMARTFEPIYFPNPKRGFVAITTYPPVYQSKSGSSGTEIVVPRVYPPIYVKPTGRNRR